jgi:hypothetical protein
VLFAEAGKDFVDVLISFLKPVQMPQKKKLMKTIILLEVPPSKYGLSFQSLLQVWLILSMMQRLTSKSYQTLELLKI